MESTPISRRLLAAGLSQDFARLVQQQSRTALSAGASLQVASGPRMVASGWIVAQQDIGRGVMQILKIYMPGDLIERADALLPTTKLAALTSATVANVPSDSATTSAFAAFEREDMNAKARHALEHSIRLGRFDALQKMAHFLLEIDARWRQAHERSTEDATFPFRQPHIADYLALSPVHVNRTLMTFRRSGLVDVARGRLTIHDREGLAKAVERKGLSAVITNGAVIHAH